MLDRELVLISVLYRTGSDFHVALEITGNNDPLITLGITHRNIFETSRTAAISGCGTSEEITVQDGEHIIIVARRETKVIARATFEVSTDLIEDCGMILHPRYTTNLVVIDQCETAIVSRAAQRALDAVFAEPVEEGAQVL
jgi:hypothetical protein